MKKIINYINIILVIFLCIGNINIFAKNNLPNLNIEKPKFEVPDNMPDVNESLKEKYDKALEGLSEKGFGKNNYPNGLPDLKSPENFGKNANDVFQKKYGDMWETNPINKEWASQGLKNNSSKEDLDKHISDFSSKYSKQFNEESSTEKQFNKKNSNVLKASNKWTSLMSLSSEEIAKENRLFSEKDKQNFFNSIKKPEGFEKTKNAKMTIPKQQKLKKVSLKTPKGQKEEQIENIINQPITKETVIEKGKEIGKKAWDGTKNLGKKAWDGTKNLGKKIWNGTKNLGKKIWNKIKPKKK